MEKFGEKLRALRIRQGFTLKELSAELGLSGHGYLSELECGKKQPTTELTLRAADFFKITTDELLRDEIEIDFLSKTKPNANK